MSKDHKYDVKANFLSVDQNMGVNIGNGVISGFSKFNREQRVEVLKKQLGDDIAAELDSFLHSNPAIQHTFSEFSENYLTNFYLPFGVVPNVLVNGEMYLVPMVIEESSVVAAASRAAGFWAQHGGFKTEVLGTKKKGQVHFIWNGRGDLLKSLFPEIEAQLHQNTEAITVGMKSRGGGVSAIELVDLTSKLENYYQLDATFETADAMGANFINTCLEEMAGTLKSFMSAYAQQGTLEVVMSILSNHTPECMVRCSVNCPVEELAPMSGTYSPIEFAHRFQLAVKMAQVDVSRAVTHNKGIYNGIDGVVLATGNDWRAVEAAGHAYAATSGSYQALSDLKVDDGVFTYTITVPLSVGTVGGLTKSHPMAAFALKLLRNPSAKRLMEIMAAMGMANNFSAVTSLVTSGIQKGHMKMHLANILTQLGASDAQKKAAKKHFDNKVVSYSAVQKYLGPTARPK
jgi:hydroxymethylglutaryl-CoA reductase